MCAFGELMKKKKTVDYFHCKNVKFLGLSNSLYFCFVTSHLSESNINKYDIRVEAH